MSDVTKIEWCDSTRKPGPPPNPARDGDKQQARQRINVEVRADVFDNDVDPQWRADLFELIAATPNIDWLLLTKRIGNVLAMACGAKETAGVRQLIGSEFMPPNVWLGATICNQTEADRDIPKLLAVPAAKRFLSIEPMLGPVDLTRLCTANHATLGAYMNALRGHVWQESAHDGGDPPLVSDPPDTNSLDWVICGGESGPHARPMNPAWARSLRDQCAAAGVPFLFNHEMSSMLGRGVDTPPVVSVRLAAEHLHDDGMEAEHGR